jgi:hypothetical protein
MGFGDVEKSISLSGALSPFHNLDKVIDILARNQVIAVVKCQGFFYRQRGIEGPYA